MFYDNVLAVGSEMCCAANIAHDLKETWVVNHSSPVKARWQGKNNNTLCFSFKLNPSFEPMSTFKEKRQNTSKEIEVFILIRNFQGMCLLHFRSYSEPNCPYNQYLQCYDPQCSEIMIPKNWMIPNPKRTVKLYLVYCVKTRKYISIRFYFFNQY